MSALLEVHGLAKSYGGIAAVKDVSFEARSGEMVAIIGPSGSGKSTLLSLLGLLDAPDSGSLSLDGKELASLSESERTHFRAKQVGFLMRNMLQQCVDMLLQDIQGAYIQSLSSLSSPRH